MIIRLENFKAARLDDAMRRTLLEEQLDEFLNERVRRLQAGEPVEPLRFECDASLIIAPLYSRDLT